MAQARIRAAVGNAAAEMSGISSRYQSRQGVGNLKHCPEGKHPWKESGMCKKEMIELFLFELKGELRG